MIPLHEMTMRDFVAFLAMQASANQFGLDERAIRELAEHSYEVADAMLRQREESE